MAPSPRAIIQSKQEQKGRTKPLGECRQSPSATGTLRRAWGLHAASGNPAPAGPGRASGPRGRRAAASRRRPAADPAARPPAPSLQLRPSPATAGGSRPRRLRGPGRLARRDRRAAAAGLLAYPGGAGRLGAGLSARSPSPRSAFSQRARPARRVPPRALPGLVPRLGPAWRCGQAGMGRRRRAVSASASVSSGRRRRSRVGRSPESFPAPVFRELRRRRFARS